MSILRSMSIPLYRNPSLAPAASALGAMLRGAGYHQHARGTIVALALAHGEPTASVELCDEDEADAVDAWVDALPTVPYDDPAWDAPDAFLDVELMAHGSHPLPIA